mmetsp:Transcript_33172/g.81523  ORF Transcript_33172/g.81523 Transcript_33172/m.81523 type:complete len:167 (-) Transcript_33172:759-1259(-)
MYGVGRGVKRSKRKAMEWCRKGAELVGDTTACRKLAMDMYADEPYAREVGHLAEATVADISPAVAEGHLDVPVDVLFDVLHWLRKAGEGDPIAALSMLRREVIRREVEGGAFCSNDGCDVVGPMKDFKRCQKCKISRYCGAECQKQDWTTGGHRERCGKAEWAQVK